MKQPPADKLRNYFIVDELQQAALNGDRQKLELVREIVRRIKLSQLDAKKIADDDMVKQILEDIQTDLGKDLIIIEQYLKDL